METSYISRREQAQLTKKKIFDTTLFLIRKKGYGKITIREICQNAQISIGTFYLYFSSKDEILLEIYNKIDQKISFPRPDDPEKAPSFIIRNFSIYLECMIESFDKELLREIYRNSLISGENHFLSPRRPLFEAVLELVSFVHADTGFKKEAAPDELCRRLHIFVQSYIFQWLVSDDLSPDYLAGSCLPELRNYLSLYMDFR